MICKKLMDKDDPREVRLHEGRLKKRLRKFGFALSKGKTETGKIQLKRIPPKRGFRITDLATGAVVLGEKHDLSLDEVEAFWLQKDNERWAEKRKAKEAKEALKQRRRKEIPKVETFPAIWW